MKQEEVLVKFFNMNLEQIKKAVGDTHYQNRSIHYAVPCKIETVIWLEDSVFEELRKLSIQDCKDFGLKPKDFDNFEDVNTDCLVMYSVFTNDVSKFQRIKDGK